MAATKADYNRIYHLRLYHTRKQAGRCVACGEKKPRGRNQVRCASCAVLYKTSRYAKYGNRYQTWKVPKKNLATLTCLRCDSAFPSWDRRQNRLCPVCSVARDSLCSHYAFLEE